MSTLKKYIVIESDQDYMKAMFHIKNAKYLAYDTETDGLNTRKNQVIGFSFCGKAGESFYAPLKVFNGVELVDHKFKTKNLELLTLLSDKYLVMYNGSFDCRITKNSLGVNLLPCLVADVMLMKHTLQEEPPFGLKDVAIMYQSKIGLDAEKMANEEQIILKQNIAAKGGSTTKGNFEIFKADLDVLGSYAAADSDLTLRLFDLFYSMLESENLLDFFFDDEVMPLYTLVTIPMEDKGIYLDMPKLIKYKNEIAEELKKLESEIIEAILSTDAGRQLVKDLKAEHQPSTKGSFVQVLCEILDLPLPKTMSNKYSVTAKNLRTLEGYPEVKAFFAGEAPLPEHLVDQIQTRLMGDQPININSKQQLGKLVFGYMGIEPLSKTDKGSPQFNDDTITHLIKDHHIEWAKSLQVYNRLAKINGSYYERFFDEQEDGIFYPTFKQHATTSGRFGGDAQQLPRPKEDEDVEPRVAYYNNVIRELFIPKPGYIFIDDDYSSLEPVVFSHNAGDQALLDIFLKDEDFYSKIAIMVDNLTDCSADKSAPNFLKKKYPDLRQKTKSYALGIAYGMKAGKLSMQLKIPKEEAEIIIHNYFKAFPKLKEKMDDYLQQAKTTGMVKSSFGRIRHLPEVKKIYTQFKDDLMDYRKLRLISQRTYIPMDQLSELRSKYNNLLNNALNFPIQSAATSIVNRAAIAMTSKFKELDLDAWVSLQIHDELVVSCREDQLNVVSKIVQDCMENTTKLSIPLVAIPTPARNLREGK